MQDNDGNVNSANAGNQWSSLIWGCPSVVQWVDLALVGLDLQLLVSPFQVHITIYLQHFDTVGTGDRKRIRAVKNQVSVFRWR